MIADLVVTVAIYRSGGGFRALCQEFEAEATGSTPEDAKEEVLAVVRRRIAELAAEGRLAACLAAGGFVVDGGVLRAERRLVSIDEGRIPIEF